ncbi:sensor histidine kinase [Paenibacillus chitinolyticus]|uniref:sensor histidine kinase n=1 Tax=Paenibacillus chitinolyticus TaxID=79263 RepID=UPI00362C6B33
MHDKAWTRKRFLFDRLLYTAAFFFAILLVLVVLWLDRMEAGLPVKPDNLVYLFLLAGAVWIGVLIYDYVRQAGYASALNKRLGESAQSSLDSALFLPSRTMEQQAVNELLQKQHRAYLSTLSSYRAAQEQHLHFTNQWVHQLKTPVSVIDLLIQQSEGTLTPPERIQELLTSIQEENEKIASGLQMMLYTARLEKFELDVHPRRIELTAVARRIVNDYKKACIRASIFPKIESSAPDIYVETDEKWLSFVLHQLIGNAIKYSRKREGNKPLLIRIEQKSYGTRLEVQDSGIGIAAEDLPRVFDAFFTGENGRGVVTESTGMGLYLVKQVMSRLGHQVDIQSEPGQGTTVSLMFQSQGLHRFGERDEAGGVRPGSRVTKM